MRFGLIDEFHCRLGARDPFLELLAQRLQSPRQRTLRLRECDARLEQRAGLDEIANRFGTGQVEPRRVPAVSAIGVGPDYRRKLLKGLSVPTGK